MLSEIRIGNFKAFGVTQRVRMAPITMVFGPNSAGKSSLLKALGALRQSFPARDDTFGLVLNGPHADLGSYELVTHQSLRSSPITLGFSFRLSKDVIHELDNKFAQNTKSSVLLDENATLSVDLEFSNTPGTPGERWAAPTLSRMSLSPTPHRIQLDSAPPLVQAAQVRLDRVAKGHYSSDALDGAAFIDHWARRESLQSPVGCFVHAASDVSETYVDPMYISNPLSTVPWLLSHEEWDSSTREGTGYWLFHSVAAAFALFVQGIRCLGPLRARPQRLYRIEGSGDDVGASGDALARHLSDEATRETVNRMLAGLDLGYQVNVVPVDGAEYGDECRILIQDLSSGRTVPISEVGFGISQTLPIVTQATVSIQSSERLMPSLVTVEQPETHLHPRMQAQLADLFAMTARAESADAPLTVQWLVETHSEAMILRLQRRIREGQLRPESVAVIYVSPDLSGSQVRELRLGDDGDFIDEWPDGFFAERLDDLLADGGSKEKA